MATYKLGGKDLTQEQVDTAYTKGTVDQRAMLNQKLGLSYDVNTGKASQYQQPVGTDIQGNIDTTIPPGSKSMSASITPIGQQKTEGAPTIPVTPVTTQQEIPITTQPQPISVPQVTTPPTQVEKTTTTTPEGQTVVKKETPQVVTPDYNVGKGREQDILTNLKEGYSQDPAVQKAITSGDYETYKQAYGYDTADQTKKTMLDAFYQAHQPKNSEAFLQILATGQKIQNAQYRSSPEAADAQHRYDILSPYIGANANTLYDAMVSGKIAPGSDAYKDLLKVSGGVETPAMTEAKLKLERKQQIDKVNGNLASISGQKAETTTGLQKISDNLVQTKGMDYATEFQKDVVNNPAITEKVTELNGVTEQIKNLEYTKSKSLREIIKQHPGISMGAAILEANKQNEGINDELNQLYNKQGSLKANVDYATNLAEKMFGYKMAQNQEAVRAQQEIAQEERQFGRQKELAQFQQQLGLEGQQAEFEQKVRQQAQMASDPYTAISTVMEQYQKLGVPFTQSIQTKIADAQKFIDAGGTIGGYVDKMIKDIQAKPEYKALYAPKPTAQPQVWTKLDDTTLYNQATGESKKVSSLTKGASATDLLSVPSGTVIPSRLGETTNPNNGKECAEYVNDIAGLGMGDSYASKVAKTNTQIHEEAGVGNIAVWNPNPKDPVWNKYGHAGIITQDLGDSWEITSSNLHGDGAVTRDIVPKKSINSYNTEKKISVPSIKTTTGTDVATLGQFLKDNQSRGPGYSEEDVKAFDSKIDRFIKTGDEQGMALSFRKNLMEDKDFKQEFDNTQKFVKALDTVQTLVNDYEKAGKSTNAAKAFAEKIARGLGVTTDTALAQLQTQMGFTLANYIRSISGTAASDTEVQRLMGNMAQLGNVKDLNTAIVSQAKNNGLSGLKSMIDSRMYGMPDTLKPLVFGDIYGQAESNMQIGTNSTDEDILNYLNQ